MIKDVRGRGSKYYNRPNPQIRMLLKELNIPQHRLAFECRISEATLSRWLDKNLEEDDERYVEIMKALDKYRNFATR